MLTAYAKWLGAGGLSGFVGYVASVTTGVDGGEAFAAGGVIAAVTLAVIRAFYGEAPIHRSVKVIEQQREEAEEEARKARAEADEARADATRWRKHSLQHEQVAWRWEQRARVWHRRALDSGWPDLDATVQSAHPDDD